MSHQISKMTRVLKLFKSYASTGLPLGILVGSSYTMLKITAEKDRHKWDKSPYSIVFAKGFIIGFTYPISIPYILLHMKGML